MLSEAAVSIHLSVPGCVVEHSEHGHNAIGVPIRSSNVAACGSDVVHSKANATSTLGDACTLLQCVVNPLQSSVKPC